MTLAEAFNYGVPTGILLILAFGVFRLIPKFLRERREDRREEMNLRTAERAAQGDVVKTLFTEIKDFGNRIASASEGQAKAIECIAAHQREQSVLLDHRFKALELGIKVNTQLLERIAAGMPQRESA
jgi:hypothetical protein